MSHWSCSSGWIGGGLALVALVGCAGDPSQAAGDDPSMTRPDAGPALDAAVADAQVDPTGDPGSADAAQPPLAAPSRYYAHVPLAMDPRSGRERFTAQNIADDANMVTLHFDFFGIPWDEFASGAPLPAAWVAEMDAIASLVEQLDLPVFLALTPLHGLRNKLGPAASGVDDLALNHDFGAACEDIALRPDAGAVRDGYAAYVRHMVDRFEPVFLALSIEVNLYREQCPMAWPSMEGMLNAVREAEKARAPALPIFHTFHLETLWQASEQTDPCFGYSTTCLDANMAALASLQTDVMALSTYPLVPASNNGQLPADWFSAVADRTPLPLAVAETGYQAASIQAELDAQSCFDALPTSPQDQGVWMDRLLTEAESHDMPFVTWWSSRDLMPTSASGSCRCVDDEEPWCTFLAPLPAELRLLYQFFGSMGLREVGGTPRAALAPWLEAVRAAER